MITAEEYLKLFETNIIINGVEKGLLKTNLTMVPVRPTKLDNKPFGKFLKTQFEYDKSLVIDYYGLLKKSTGFYNKYESYTDIEIKRLKSNLVHFASIKIEDIVNLDKSLAVDFPGFKKYLVDLRGFTKVK